MEKRKGSKFPNVNSTDVEFDQDVFETKHKRWLARRRFVSVSILLSIIFVAVFFYVRYSNDSSISTETGTESSSDTKVSNKLSLEDLQHTKDELQSKCDILIDSIRKFKSEGVIIEKSSNAQLKVMELQNTLRELIPLIYGPEPYIIEMSLKFPDTMPDYVENGANGIIRFELGPLSLVPYSTYYFLDIVKDWKGGKFHRNAGHVLQAMVTSRKPSLAFQEYHINFPHKQYTLGYAGRPGGPEFYISTVDNTDNHGPGSQGSDTEADSCFGKILVHPEYINIVKRMQKQPGRMKPNGFIDKPSNYIDIVTMKLIR